MDKLTAIRIKQSDGTYGDLIPIGTTASNVDWDSTHSLTDILGNVAISTKGSIQNQIDSAITDYGVGENMQDKTQTYDNVQYIGDTGAIRFSSNAVAAGAKATAFGDATAAMGNYSIAEGSQTATQAIASHAEGLGTVATGNYQHVSGKYNILDSNFVEIVGGGTDNNNRANLRTLDWNGNETLVGLLTIGNSTSTDTHSVVVSNTTAGDVVLGVTSSGHRGIYMRPHGTSTSGFWPIIADTNNVIEVYGQRVLAGKEDNSTDEGRFSARSSLGSIILHSDPNGVKGIRLAAHGTATDDSNIIFADTNNVVTFRGDQFIGSKYGDGTNAAFYATSDNPAFAAVSSKYADHYIELIYGTSGNYGLYTHDGTSGSWLIQKTQAGAVTIDDKTPVYTSTAQTISGTKTFLGDTYPIIRHNTAGYMPSIQFANGLNNGDPSARIGMTTEGTTGRQSRVSVRINSYASSTNKNISYYEYYHLPVVTADMTADKSYNIITTKNLTDIPDASGTVRGMVSTGKQTFAGVKTFTDYPKIKATLAGAFLRLQFVNGLNDDEESAGIGLYLDGAHGRQSQFGIRMVSYSSSTYKNLAYHEDYWLPSVTADRTANVNYNILTTKSAVTIAQGGTGATNAESALSAIGGRHIFPNQSIAANGGSKTLTIGSTSTYKSLLILGTVGGVGGVVIGVTLNNGTVTARNLMTNTAWSGTGLVITASGQTVTLKNNATAATTVTVFAG